MTGIDGAFAARLILMLLWVWNLRSSYSQHGQEQVVRVSFWSDAFALVLINILLAATGWWSTPPCR